jgi:hypothetical protein
MYTSFSTTILVKMTGKAFFLVDLLLIFFTFSFLCHDSPRAYISTTARPPVNKYTPPTPMNNAIAFVVSNTPVHSDLFWTLTSSPFLVDLPTFKRSYRVMGVLGGFWLIVSAILTAVKTVDFINEPEETCGIDASVWFHQLGIYHAEEIVKVPLPRFRACRLFRMGFAMVHVHNAPLGMEQFILHVYAV